MRPRTVTFSSGSFLLRYDITVSIVLCHKVLLEQQDVDPSTAPVVMWLNGGPGSTSMLGLFEINGPIRVVSDGSGGVSGTPNPHSWHKVANMIYVDQPVGTGYLYHVTRGNSKLIFN